jgi:hypothetical protein
VKSFIFRLLAAYVSCLAGFNVAVITVPGSMGPAPFRDVIGEVFSYRFYSAELFGVIAVLSALLLLADWIGAKRIHIAWLVLIAVFSGGYFYAMSVQDYFGDLDRSITLYLRSVPLGPLATAVGWIFFLIVWLFPFVALAVIKLATSPKFRARLAVGSSRI